MHPEDRGTVQAALARAVETTGVYETEYRAVWPDGSIHHIAARGKVHRDNTGRAVSMTGVCWDITERKRAEEALREARRRLEVIVDSIADGFYALDREWRFTHANDAALRHMEKTREEILGRTLFDVFPETRAVSLKPNMPGPWKAVSLATLRTLRWSPEGYWKYTRTRAATT